MSVFFDVKTAGDQALLAAFDAAFETYRLAALGYIDNAIGLNSKDVSFTNELRQVKNLIQKSPLPSQANASEAAFGKVVALARKENELREKAFAKAADLGRGKAGDGAGMAGIFNSMMTSASQTIARPEFSAVNGALLKAVVQRLAPQA